MPLQKFLFLFVFLFLLCYIAWKDFRTHRIPNTAIIVMTVCTAAGSLLCYDRGIGFVCGGVLAGSVPLLIVNVCYANAFGGGDIKLMGAAGMLLGAKRTVVALGAGILLAGLYILIKKAAGEIQRDTEIAMAPWLCAGILASFCFGAEMIHWYLG